MISKSSLGNALPTLALAALCACAGDHQTPGAAVSPDATQAAAVAPASDYSAKLARFREVPMPYDASGLTAKQQQMVAKLLAASRAVDELYWEQSDPDGFKLYRSLAGSNTPADQQLRRLIRINGGRYDLISEHEPLAGAPPKPPGANYYPADLSLAELEAYVAKNPQQKRALYDSFTIVRRDGDKLVAIPYHTVFAAQLAPIVQSLREAADLSDDAAFAKYLRLRATALLTDDYYQSDLAWLDLKNPKFDIIIAPYETYGDGLLGLKAAYEAAVLIRNETESRKLDVFQKYVPDIQDALPLPAADRPSKKGLSTPMEVMDTPLRSGDIRHGYQAVAANLPNDPRVHELKGSKKIFFKNYMDARVKNVILPLAQRLLREDQAALASAEGVMTFVLMHEVSHGIGPAYARTKAGKIDIREAIGKSYSALEEAKADVLSLFGIHWLTEHNGYPKDKLAEAYLSRVADFFRTVRFGVAEAHGRADIMQFNYLVEYGVMSFDAATGRYAVDISKLPTTIAALTKELLEQEATGDRARTEAWFSKYGTVSAQLAQALAKASDVPVDIDPVQAAETL